MKHKANSIICCALLAGLSLAGGRAMAQTRAYRQINLAGSDPGLANNLTPGLLNPWGIAFLPGQPFVIANANSGRVIGHDANGFSLVQPSFNVRSADGTGPGFPTGMVSDPNSFFGSRDAVQPFILTTEDGAIFFWGPDSQGDRLLNATLAVDNASTGAVYTGLAILTPDCCGPFLVVANFHDGTEETYTSTFSPLAGPGNFLDPDLPAGSDKSLMIGSPGLVSAVGSYSGASAGPGGAWGEGMTEKVVWHVVKEFATKVGIVNLAPHGLRRTCTRLCHAAGGELEQIQFLLGHVSVQTTERYLGCQQRIRCAVNDCIGIEPKS